jgi:hypothetical protein
MEEGWRKSFEIDFRNSVSMSVRGQTQYTTNPTLPVHEVKALSAGERLVLNRQKPERTAINAESDSMTSPSK